MLESKIAEMLGQLSEKLGVASAKIWEWALLQVKVEVVTSIIQVILAIGLSFGAYRYYLWLYKNWKELNKWKNMNKQFTHIVLSIVLAGTLIIFDTISIVTLFELPKLLINPEYAAFENIVKQLGNLK